VIALSGALLAGVAAAPAAASPLQPTRAAAGRAQVGSDAWQLFQATNDSRGRFGLGKLVLDRGMSRVALRHSLAMVRAGTLFHTANVDTYLHGIAWRAWGENVGYTPGAVASMQDAFMASPPHRQNILNRSFTHVAIGVVRHVGYLWVTVFFYD
jgi:uncharacterized protein YkwD